MMLVGFVSSADELTIPIVSIRFFHLQVLQHHLFDPLLDIYSRERVRHEIASRAAKRLEPPPAETPQLLSISLFGQIRQELSAIISKPANTSAEQWMLRYRFEDTQVLPRCRDLYFIEKESGRTRAPGFRY